MMWIDQLAHIEQLISDWTNDNEVMRQWKDEIIRKYDYKMMRNFDDVNWSIGSHWTIDQWLNKW